MRHFAIMGTILMVAAAALTGCCEPEKEQIAALTHKNDVLMTQNKDFRDQVTDLEKYNDQLKKDSDGKDQVIAGKNEQIAQLEQKLVGGATADGWQKGTFGDKISVGSDILFSPGRATLKAAGRSAMGRIAGDIKSRYPGLAVRVYGFTDSQPIKKSRKLWKDNLDLSANRAMAVTRYLVSQGIPEDSIETIAMGATHFVAGNKTKGERTRNRRVEIFVVKAGR